MRSWGSRCSIATRAEWSADPPVQAVVQMQGPAIVMLPREVGAQEEEEER